MADPRIHRRHTDPYAPHPSAGPLPAPAPVLPSERLWRLGGTPRAVAAYKRAWEDADGAGREALAGRLAVMTDAVMGEELANVDGLHDAAVPYTVAWCRSQPDVGHAVRLAEAVEAARPVPRATLAEKLAGLT